MKLKSLFLWMFLPISLALYAQKETVQKITTEVNAVTVFIKDAQITRNKKIYLNKGENMLTFVSLSPFINSKSIQVKTSSALTVLGVNHQHNHVEKKKLPAEIKKLSNQLELIEEQLVLENTYLDILREELSFLRENKNISGKNTQVNVSGLEQASNFYSSKLKSLKLKEIELNKKIKGLRKQVFDVENQIKTISSKKVYPSGEVSVKVAVKKAGTYSFQLNYLVENASWYPTYDIRAKSIKDPTKLVYKANVKQDTKVDWKNVKLTFSSGNPSVSGVVPNLKTFFLDYNTSPPNYRTNVGFDGSVSGTVIDENGQPFPGVNVIITGTTVGTTSDFDGNYSIVLPDGKRSIQFSYVGYKNKNIFVTDAEVDVQLKPDMNSLDELVVVGYGTTNKRKRKGHTGAVKSMRPSYGYTNGDQADVIEEAEELEEIVYNTVSDQEQQKSNSTVLEFEVALPYTIKSEHKKTSVEMISYNLPATYQYYCVPKIEEDVFLTANITGWEKYNLLEGEANLYYEDTFIGKSILDVRNAKDTLQISLGRDKQVVVKREKVKSFTSKQFIGNKKQETLAYKTQVKNNKPYPVNLIVLDQIPVSVNKEIQVEISKKSGAKHNPENGQLKWEFELKPQQSKELELNFTVKYPKNRSLILE